MVEMDVGQQDGGDVTHRDPVLLQRRTQCLEATRRARIDQRHAAGGLQHGGRDDPWEAKEVHINVRQASGNRVHNCADCTMHLRPRLTFEKPSRYAGQ